MKSDGDLLKQDSSGKTYGNAPEFWLSFQQEVDLWEAKRTLKTV